MDLELGLDSENVTKSQGSQSIRKNISLKLKQNSVGGNDSQKLSKRDKIILVSKSSSAKGTKISNEASNSGSNFLKINSSISSIESLLKNKVMKVGNKVNLVGEKVVDPLIHTCEICLLPILIYGRLMPCKHIFCFTCAKKTEKNCPRCNVAVSKIEQSALGTVFVCTVGGSKHGVSGCHRTYLSQRDLQSHIQYRHMNQRSSASAQQQQQQQLVSSQEQLQQQQAQQQQQQQHAMLLGPNIMHPPPSMDYLGQLPPSSVQYVTAPPIYLARPHQQQTMMMTAPPGGHMINVQQQVMQPMMIQQSQQQASDLMMAVSTPQQQQQQQQNIMVMAPRTTNLITVPIQDEDFHSRSMQQFQQDLQQAHYNHPPGGQFVVQQQQQQQQQQAAQQGQQLQASQTQFVMGQSQIINRTPMIGQGHLRPQATGGNQMVNPQLVAPQMNIHTFQRFEDPNQHAQFISNPQGVAPNPWMSNQRPQIAQQGPPSAGPNQQIQYF